MLISSGQQQGFSFGFFNVEGNFLRVSGGLPLADTAR
jgi:hypothetical protein